MEGAMTVLSHGGILPQYQIDNSEPSPRRKGVKQGAMLMLIGAILVPLLGVFIAYAPGRIELVFEFFCALAAIICFVGGPMRMLYAALFEESAQRRAVMPQGAYVPPPMPPPLNASARVSALPPATVNPANSWRDRPQTAEIVQPRSVAEGTTRLLDKSDSKAD